jgi:two-component system, OmpR family, response regulator
MNYNYHIFSKTSFGAVLKSYLEINDYTITWVDDGKYAVERFRTENSTFVFSM